MRELTTYQPQIYSVLPPDTTDDRLIELWLDGRPVTTQQGYRIDVRAFFTFVDKPLSEVHLGDLQEFAHSLDSYEDATKARRLKAVKSLLTFAARTQYLPLNVGAALRLPKVKRRLHERILTEEQVLKMFLSESNPRNRLLLRMLYFSGMRVSELCRLCWKDLYPGPNGTGIIALDGKGSKERNVPIKKEVYEEFLAFQDSTLPTDAIFRSRGGGRAGKRSGGHLSKTQVERLVQQAADKAKLGIKVTPHFFRHSHATHAAKNGAPAPLVKVILGHESLETTMIYFDIAPAESSSFFLKL